MKRYTELDILKIIASFAVILNHAAGAHTPSDTHSAAFMIICSLNALSHFSVPVFMMISGRLILESSADIKTAILRALKCAVWIIIWNLVYLADELFRFGGQALRMSEPIHLWYLYSAAVLYAMSPILSVFVKNASERLFHYSLLAGIILFPPILLAANFSAAAANMSQKMHISASFGFIWCWLFGYYIQNTKFPRPFRYTGIFGAVITTGGTLAMSYFSSTPDYRLFSFAAPNTLLYAAGVFYCSNRLFKRFAISARLRALICLISKSTAIAYGIHMLILEKLSVVIFTENPILRVIILSIATWGISISTGIIFLTAKAAVLKIYKKIKPHRGHAGHTVQS